MPRDPPPQGQGRAQWSGRSTPATGGRRPQPYDAIRWADGPSGSNAIPPPTRMLRICAALDVTPNDLLTADIPSGDCRLMIGGFPALLPQPANSMPMT